MITKTKTIHPGETLKREFLDRLNLTVYRASKDSGIKLTTLQMIVSGKRSVSAETALRLAEYLKGTTPEFWLDLQARYDLSAAKKIQGQLKGIKPVETGAKYAIK